MNWIKSLVSLGMAALTIFTPQLQHVISQHPNIATGIASAFAVWLHLSPSPTGAAVVPESGEKGTAIAVK